MRYFSAYSRQRLGAKSRRIDDLAARVQRRARAARMDAAAVEPRGHIHRAVGRTQREMHHHIVRGQHLVDIVDRHALGPVGRARGVQAGGFVVDMRGESRPAGSVSGCPDDIIRIAGMVRRAPCAPPR